MYGGEIVKKNRFKIKFGLRKSLAHDKVQDKVGL